MSTLTAVAGSLIGVILGAGLSSWHARRAEVRKLFLDAMRALSFASVAHWIATKTSVGNVRKADRGASDHLTQRMHDEFVDALLELRKALAAVAPLCPEVASYLKRWNWEEVQSEEVQEDLQRALRRGLRRELRRW